MVRSSRSAALYQLKAKIDIPMAAVTPNIEHSGCMMTNARPPEPTPREALLARESCSASGDDPVTETDDGPEPVRPPTEPAIHPFTGKFADPELAAAYRSRAFRMMMPFPRS